jgi:hypothetical protein
MTYSTLHHTIFQLVFNKLAYSGLSPAYFFSSIAEPLVSSPHLSSLETKMVDLYDNATQYGPQDIEELPRSVNVHHYQGKDDYCRVVLLELRRLYSSSGTAKAISGSCEGRQDDPITLPETEGTQSDYIIFIIHPLTFAHDFLDPERYHPSHGRVSFNPKTHILVVKMLLPVHELVAVTFNDTLKSALRKRDLHGLIYSWGSTTLTGGDGTTKEADGGWGSRRPTRGTPKGPSVVLEVASSQTPGKLRRDCHYWVDPARGHADLAIGVKIHAKKPEITIDQWEWNPQCSRPIQKAHLTISKSNGETRFDPDQPTPQLLIPFHLLFRRPGENNHERDIVISAQELVEFATLVWEGEPESEQE